MKESLEFALGQRWVSDTESDLGLGTVVEMDARTVTVFFSASDETRVYAKQNAPLTRVIFNVGDTIESYEGWSLLVDDVKTDGQTMTYVGRKDETSAPIELKEILLNHHIRFNQPQDKLFAGQLDRLDHFVLRYQALHHQYQQLKSPLRGLCGMRAGLIPHQLHIAHEVGRRHAPRVLLADEVGLGKTIEAGMIIHQQILLGRSSRVLIVVPDSLLHQWLVEMLRRFNLHFAIFDEERCQQFSTDENPFESEQYVLCSLDFFCQHPNYYQQALEANWDLLVVDEAHHLQWQVDAPSREYEVIEALAKQIAGVLLLTATPEQLGHQSHFARLRLLDPDRFHDYEQFVIEEARYGKVAKLVAAIQTQTPWQAQFDQYLNELSLDANTQALFDKWKNDQLDDEKEQEDLITTLIDRYGTGRILFRNTRAAVQGFPKRQVNLIALDKPQDYEEDSLTPELGWVSASPWWMSDPRVDWLLHKVKEKRSEKLLVIAANASTALELEQALREREGVRATVFHEGMSILERDKAAAYFAEEEGGAQVLICSEIGSEGRNFQFAHQLIMFDLPPHPDLLEQRIGRLDRIGQTQTIQIHALYFKQTASDSLAHWYHQGLNAFEATCPAGRAVYEQYQARLLTLLASPQQVQDLAQLIEDTAATHQELTQALEQGRDRLLEKQSNGGEQAKAIAAQIAQADQDPQLVEFASDLFDIIGLNQEEKGEATWVVTPSEQMLVPSFPGLPYDGATITYHRDLALSREDMHFMSWEHPMIQGGIDVLLSEGIGTNNVAVLPNPKLPVGSLFLELIYLVDAQAPRHTGIHQFLPNTPIRILLDQQGNNLSQSVAFEALNPQLRPIDKNMARKVVKSVQPIIQTLINQANELVVDEVEKVKQTSAEQMKNMLQAEHQRLVALKQWNPSIRSEEVERIEWQISQLSQYIDDAQWQLDALRVIVVSEK